MRKLLLGIITCFISALSLSGQDIIYTIQGKKDGHITHLNSILMENLTNQTKLLLSGLPVQDVYQVDLRAGGLVSVNDLLKGPLSQAFQLVRNTPGETDIRFTGKYMEKVLLNLYTISGQRVYSHQLNGLHNNDIINLRIPTNTIYILNLDTESGSVNFKVAGSSTHHSSSFQIRSLSNQTAHYSNQTIAVQVKNLQQGYSDFSFQMGDSLRVTAFLDGYFTYPHGLRIDDSKAVTFNMLVSTSDLTGVSDRYNPVPTDAYSVREYDIIAGTTTLALTNHAITIIPGDILTIDMDTLGLIQRVVRIREEDNEIIVETKTAYMDELFVNKTFKLNTVFMEPKAQLKSDATQEFIRALTDDQGFIHPVKIIYHDEQGNIRVKSALDGGFEKQNPENIISFHENISKTDLYGTKGSEAHFYIDEGYTLLKLDAVFEFDFKHEGELTEDTKVKRGDLNYFGFLLDAESGSQSKLALDMQKPMESEGKEKLFRMPNATAKFIVPPGVPVWITFSCDVYSLFSFSADAPLNASWGFKNDHSIQPGGKYLRAGNDFTPIYDYTSQNEIYPLKIEGAVNATARMELYPRVDIRLYGFSGPFAEIAPSVESSYRSKLLTQNPSAGNETFLGWNSALDLGLDLRTGTSLKFLLQNQDFGPIDINCFNTPFWASPVNLVLLTQIPAQVNPGQQHELKLRVTDLLNMPVAFCAVSFEGDGEFSKKLLLTGSDGIATITWMPGSENGEKNATAKIYNATGSVLRMVSFSTEVSPNELSVTTLSVTNITTTTARSGGNVTSDGGAAVSSRGVVWSTSQNPTLENNQGITSNGTGKGSFTSIMTELTPKNTYYVRAYATNSEATAYGKQQSFTTPESDTAHWPRDTQTEVIDVLNPATGTLWMDRNLGATRAAISSTDVEAFGHLYQWGRAADGHQLRASGTASIPESSDNPGHDDFILAPDFPYDWRSPQNDHLWQEGNGINNPCPTGYGLPTETELHIERMSWSSNNAAGAFASPLKLPLAGFRFSAAGSIYGFGTLGHYWSGTVNNTDSRDLSFSGSGASMNSYYRAGGHSVRCIKDADVGTYTLNLIVSPADGGTLTGAGRHAEGASATITASPNWGYTFINWTGDGGHIDNPNNTTTTVTTPAYSINLTASFERQINGHSPRDTHTVVVDVLNPATGKIWMDRNLGATRAATSSTDVQAFGHLYQWGRAADWHQIRASGTVSILSSSDNPGHDHFILAPDFPYDWRSPQNQDLWQGENGTNNPCPTGYRLPTEEELNTERLSWSSNNAHGAFASPLKLPLAGFRYSADGSIFGFGTLGHYWSGTVDGTYSRDLGFSPNDASMNSYYPAGGHSVRCIKD